MSHSKRFRLSQELKERFEQYLSNIESNSERNGDDIFLEVWDTLPLFLGMSLKLRNI